MRVFGSSIIWNELHCFLTWTYALWLPSFGRNLELRLGELHRLLSTTGKNLKHFPKAVLKSILAPCPHFIGSEMEMWGGGMISPGPPTCHCRAGNSFCFCSPGGRCQPHALLINAGYSLTALTRGSCRSSQRPWATLHNPHTAALPVLSPSWNLASWHPFASLLTARANMLKYCLPSHLLSQNLGGPAEELEKPSMARMSPCPWVRFLPPIRKSLLLNWCFCPSRNFQSVQQPLTRATASHGRQHRLADPAMAGKEKVKVCYGGARGKPSSAREWACAKAGQMGSAWGHRSCSLLRAKGPKAGGQKAPRECWRTAVAGAVWTPHHSGGVKLVPGLRHSCPSHCSLPVFLNFSALLTSLWRRRVKGSDGGFNKVNVAAAPVNRHLCCPWQKTAVQLFWIKCYITCKIQDLSKTWYSFYIDNMGNI